MVKDDKGYRDFLDKLVELNGAIDKLKKYSEKVYLVTGLPMMVNGLKEACEVLGMDYEEDNFVGYDKKPHRIITVNYKGVEFCNVLDE